MVEYFNCDHCGYYPSSLNNNCANCGKPVSESSNSWLFWVFLLVLLIVIIPGGILSFVAYKVKNRAALSSQAAGPNAKFKLGMAKFWKYGKDKTEIYT
jgi:hypothetical protein